MMCQMLVTESLVPPARTRPFESRNPIIRLASEASDSAKYTRALVLYELPKAGTALGVLSNAVESVRHQTGLADRVVL